MRDKLKQNLEELRNELKKTDSDHPALNKLAGEVDHAIDQTDEISRTLAQSLRHAAEEFETRHPQLTAAINNVMTSLSNLGI